MKVVFALFALFAVALAQSSNSNPCDQSGALPSNIFNNLINSLNGQPNTILRYEMLSNFASNLTYGFSASQAVTLGTAFAPNTIYMTQVYQDMSIHMLGMLCSDVVNILNTISNEIQKLDILPSIANLTTDIHNAKNNIAIVNNFQNYFNKQDAQKIIDAAVPLSCVFGPITAKRLVFVVDVSGSMGTTFTSPTDGKTYTRLQYVQQDLSNIITNVLQGYQEFNVEFFSDSSVQWQAGVQPVTPATIASAVQWVNKGVPVAGTNTYGAMKMAFADPNVLAVFLLSDGQPNSGQAGPIVQLAQSWAQQGKGRTVNTVCFQVGGTYDPNAISFMKQVATVTGGTFRSIV